MIELGDNPTSIFKGIPLEAQERILEVRTHFPELDGTILTFQAAKQNPYFEGLAEWSTATVKLTPNGWTCRYIIAHELTHMVQQYVKTIPHGERSCDLYTIARSPALMDRPPYYLSIPREMYAAWDADTARYCHDAARMAIKKRSEGTRQYIKWFEETLKIGSYFRGNCEVVTSPRSVAP